MKRAALPIVAAILGVGILILLGLRPRGPRPTTPPTEAELRAFARLVPDAFRPEIAKLERGLPPSPANVPFAIGIADGATIQIVPPAGSGVTPYSCRFGQIYYDGEYLAPPVPIGREIVPIAYTSPTARREVRLLVSGAQGIGTPRISYYEKPVLAEGNSGFVDLGPLPQMGGQYTLVAPGSTSDGFGIVPKGASPPRKIAMAPAELPSDVKPEPGGYALLFDQAVVWRSSESFGTMTADYLEGPTIALLAPDVLRRMLLRRKHTSAQQVDYRITSFAHVYVRQGDRWRYARTWWLEANGSAWIAEDEPTFRREFRSPISGRPNPLGANFGAPKLLQEKRIVRLTP